MYWYQICQCYKEYSQNFTIKWNITQIFFLILTLTIAAMSNTSMIIWNKMVPAYLTSVHKREKEQETRGKTRRTKGRDDELENEWWIPVFCVLGSMSLCARVELGLLAPVRQAARRAPPFKRVSRSWNKDGVVGDPSERGDRSEGETSKRDSRTGAKNGDS